jgi:hypothetical protein
MKHFDAEFIRGLQARLAQHPIYDSLRSLDDLRVFMAHHVHSVWDFMSLIKCLQHAVAPTAWPWVPGMDATVQRFINELVLEEETDQNAPGQTTEFSSHFMLYIAAMREIGADTQPILDFVAIAGRDGIAAAFDSGLAPAPAVAFNRVTFEAIDSGKAHVVAAALALGREHIIPLMFRAFLGHMRIDQTQAPIFHFYLQRHIHLDQDFHGPLSLRLLEALCGNDSVRHAEAREAAMRAVSARLEFWDGVLQALPSHLHKEAA